MNERIRELAEQAQFNDLAFDKWGDAYDVKRLDPEKFAELIVRECMKEAWEEIVADEDIAQEQDTLNREYLNGNNQGIVDAVVRFRNHFGVDE
jgi:hypothetical protein